MIFPVVYSKYPLQYLPGALNKAQKTGSWSAVKCIITFFSCNNFRVSVYIKTTANPNIWFIFNFFFNFYHVIYARFYHTVNYSLLSSTLRFLENSRFSRNQPQSEIHGPPGQKYKIFTIIENWKSDFYENSEIKVLIKSRLKMGQMYGR